MPDRSTTRATAYPRRVLVAEDDAELRELFARAFESYGAVVDRASDGAAALGMLLDEGSRHDIVVSDVRMPGRSGVEVLAAVRASGSSLPFVLMTAFGDARVCAVAEGLGRNIVLAKPLGLDALLRAVSELLRGDQDQRGAP